MSALGEAKDARASRAKPRPEGGVCERRWHPTRYRIVYLGASWKALRRARQRTIALDDAPLVESIPLLDGVQS
jgi:hypothetical protein